MMRSRREFLTSAAQAVLAGTAAAALGRAPGSLARARELRADVVIVGGGLGDCAAALSAASRGLSVLLTEETDWK